MDKAIQLVRYGYKLDNEDFLPDCDYIEDGVIDPMDKAILLVNYAKVKTILEEKSTE